VRTKIVPAVTGELEKIKKGLGQNLSYFQVKILVTPRSKSFLLPGHSSATELQRITLMGNAYVTRKVLG